MGTDKESSLYAIKKDRKKEEKKENIPINLPCGKSNTKQFCEKNLDKWNVEPTFPFQQKITSKSRTPWSCGPMHHVLDWEVKGASLATVKFFFRPIVSAVFESSWIPLVKYVYLHPMLMTTRGEKKAMEIKFEVSTSSGTI